MNRLLLLVVLFFLACTKNKTVQPSQNSSAPDPSTSALYKSRIWHIDVRYDYSTRIDTAYNVPDEQFAVGYIDSFSISMPAFYMVKADTLNIDNNQSTDKISVFKKQGSLYSSSLVYYIGSDSLAFSIIYVTSLGPQQNIDYMYINAHTK